MFEVLTAGPKNIIFGKIRGQKIPKNKNLIFSNTPYFYMEDNVALKLSIPNVFILNFFCHLYLSEKYKFSAK